jgi:GDP-L-fucose synthase
VGERIWVAGHRGIVGSALVRLLRAKDLDVLTVDRATLDLRRQDAVSAFVRANRPTAIILAAGKVGSIFANDTYPVDFIQDNLAIQTNVIEAAHLADVDRLVFLASSCIFPKLAAQPIKEAALLTGPLEPTNQWFAIAKIAGILACQAYRRQYGRRYMSLIACNLYGPNDNFDLNTGHVIPALMRKFHEARIKRSPKVEIWGTGKPLREFLHVDDLAEAVHLCLNLVVVQFGCHFIDE